MQSNIRPCLSRPIHRELPPIPETVAAVGTPATAQDDLLETRPAGDGGTLLRDTVVGGALGAAYGGVWPLATGLGMYAISPGFFLMAPPLLVMTGVRDAWARRSPLPLIVDTACAAALVPIGLGMRYAGLAIALTAPLTTPFTTAAGTLAGAAVGAIFGPTLSQQR